MKQTRRHFLATATAGASTITLLPFAARAAAHASDSFDTAAGKITVHPVAHASFVMETPKGTIYVDPVGDATLYDGFPDADLILVTHEHGDHYNDETLTALAKDGTTIITNPAVMGKLSAPLKAKASAVANGGVADYQGLKIDAIPAYNITEERKNFHPQGRDNGYVLNFDGFRIYISGDTEDTPEMRALTDIDLAFVCMNLPFTMDANSAASAVSEFAPRFVYPYHYRGRDGGTQDPETFAKMLGGDTEVRYAPWYG
jgi:L-ascorbate metabolism protein UlaG (beta-lactamase superfamily)